MILNKVISSINDQPTYTEEQVTYLRQLTSKHTEKALAEQEMPDITGWESVQKSDVLTTLQDWIPRFQQRALALYLEVLGQLPTKLELEAPTQHPELTLGYLVSWQDKYEQLCTDIPSKEHSPLFQIPNECKRRAESAYDNADRMVEKLNAYLTSEKVFPVFQRCLIVFRGLDPKEQGDFIGLFFDGRRLEKREGLGGAQCGAELDYVALTTMQELLRKPKLTRDETRETESIAVILQRDIHVARLTLIERLLREVIDRLGSEPIRREISSNERLLREALLRSGYKATLGLTDVPKQDLPGDPYDTWCHLVAELFLADFPQVVHECGRSFLETCIKEAYLPKDHPGRVVPREVSLAVCHDLIETYGAEYQEMDFRPVLTEQIVHTFVVNQGLIAKQPPYDGKPLMQCVDQLVIERNFRNVMKLFPDIINRENRDMLKKLCFCSNGKFKPAFRGFEKMIFPVVLPKTSEYIKCTMITQAIIQANLNETWMQAVASEVSPEQLIMILEHTMNAVPPVSDSTMECFRVCIERLPESELKNYLMMTFFVASKKESPQDCFPSINSRAIENGLTQLMHSPLREMGSRVFEKIINLKDDPAVMKPELIQSLETILDQYASSMMASRDIRSITEFITKVTRLDGGEVMTSRRVRACGYLPQLLSCVPQGTQVYVSNGWLNAYWEVAKQSNQLPGLLKIYARVTIKGALTNGLKKDMVGDMMALMEGAPQEDCLWDIMNCLSQSGRNYDDALQQCINRLAEITSSDPSQIYQAESDKNRDLLINVASKLLEKLTPPLFDQIITIAGKRFNISVEEMVIRLENSGRRGINPKQLPQAVYQHIVRCYGNSMPPETVIKFMFMVTPDFVDGPNLLDEELWKWINDRFLKNPDLIIPFLKSHGNRLTDEQFAKSLITAAKLICEDRILHEIRERIRDRYFVSPYFLASNGKPIGNFMRFFMTNLTSNVKNMYQIKQLFSMVVYHCRISAVTEPGLLSDCITHLTNNTHPEVSVEIMARTLAHHRESEDVENILKAYNDALNKTGKSIFGTGFFEQLYVEVGGNTWSIVSIIHLSKMLELFRNPGVGTHDLSTKDKLNQFEWLLKSFFLKNYRIPADMLGIVITTFQTILPGPSINIPYAVDPARRIFRLIMEKTGEFDRSAKSQLEGLRKGYPIFKGQKVVLPARRRFI
jgi:hypothetical protein